MKYLSLLTFIIISSFTTSALSETYRERKCREADVKFTLEISETAIEPKKIYVAEGDKVCLKVVSLDERTKIISIDRHPVEVRGYPNQENFEVFTVGKIGTYEIKCRFCPLKEIPVMIVENKERIEKSAERNYRRNSIENRRNSFEKETPKVDRWK